MTTNYQNLFGDPERATETLLHIARAVSEHENIDFMCSSMCDLLDLFMICGKCPFKGMYMEDGQTTRERVAAFLESEAV